MKTHKILGFFLIISLCFSSAYMCDDGQAIDPQGQDKQKHEQKHEKKHEQKDGEAEESHQHPEGCNGHDHDHGHGHDHDHKHGHSH